MKKVALIMRWNTSFWTGPTADMFDDMCDMKEWSQENPFLKLLFCP